MLRDKKILVIAALILLLALGGWFFLSGKKPADQTLSDNKTTGSSTAESPASLKDLLTKGQSQTCTYTTDAGSGKVYVSGTSMRGDFDTQVSGTSLKSHMIVKENTSYVWTDDQNSGFKMSFDPDTSAGTSTNTNSSATTGGFDPSGNYNYKCGTWNTNASMFELPKGVTFTEFKMPSQTTTGTGAGSPSAPSQCSYCNALSGDDKAQCLTALKCN